MTFQTVIESVIKIMASVALVAAFALVFTILSQDGDISDASADVTDLVPRSVMEHESFERVVAESGLEPRPYDMNGNLVHFAAGESHLSPQELADYYQHKLIRAGINSMYYESGIQEQAMEQALEYQKSNPVQEREAGTQSGDQDIEVSDQELELFESHNQQNHAMLNGEVVPLHIGENRVTLAGIQPKRQSANLEDINHEWLRDPVHNEIDLARNMNSYRFIEAYRRPGEQVTTVNATWSEEEQFDGELMQDPSSLDHDSRVQLPTCPGCERVQRHQGLHHEEPYTLNQFKVRTPPSNVHSFYTETLGGEGWSPSGEDSLLDQLGARIPELGQLTGQSVTYKRGNEYIVIRTEPMDDDPQLTSVVTMHGEKLE